MHSITSIRCAIRASTRRETSSSSREKRVSHCSSCDTKFINASSGPLQWRTLSRSSRRIRISCARLSKFSRASCNGKASESGRSAAKMRTLSAASSASFSARLGANLESSRLHSANHVKVLHRWTDWASDAFQALTGASCSGGYTTGSIDAGRYEDCTGCSVGSRVSFRRCAWFAARSLRRKSPRLVSPPRAFCVTRW